MAEYKNIKLSDAGTNLVINLQEQGLPFDASAAITKEIKVISPAGVTKTFAASFVTDGTDGKISYNISVNDLDVLGIWKIFGYITTSSGNWTSSRDYLVVVP